MPRAFTEQERAHILAALHDAAAEAMQGRGLRKTSVAALCAAAGISKGAFYGFYDGKEALAVAVLREAEAALRAELLVALGDPDPLRVVLEVLFEQAPRRPQLALLVRPEELQWLVRSLPPGAMEDAQADDDAWFTQLFDRLAALGAVHSSQRSAFLGVPGAAMALAHGSVLLGAHGDAARRAMVGGLRRELAAPASGG